MQNALKPLIHDLFMLNKVEIINEEDAETKKFTFLTSLNFSYILTNGDE